MPYALPYALCPIPEYSSSEKGYISIVLRCIRLQYWARCLSI